MKLIPFCASIIFLSGCVSNNNQILYAQLYEENSELNTLETLKNIGTNVVRERLYDSTKADVLISEDGTILTQTGGVEISTRGRMQNCKGYKGVCLEIDTFKLMIPNSFDFETSMTWSWEEYKYEAISNRKLSVMGSDFEAVEIIGLKEEAPYQAVHFYVSKDTGLIYFILRLEDYRAAYFLSSGKGVWN